MNILSLNYEYPPLGGGAGVSTKSLNEMLVKDGNTVCLVTSWIRGLKKVEKSPQYTVNRLFSFRKNIGFSKTYEKIAYIVSTLINIGKILNQFKPDIVHCHFAVPSGFIAYYLKKRYKMPYVITSPGGDVPGFSPDETGKYFLLFNWLFQVIWKNADKVIAKSKGLSNLIKKAYGIDVTVIPNGIKLSDYKVSGNHHEKIRLLYAGRFSKQKNIGFLIKVLAALKSNSWILYLIGDGPEKKKINKLILEYQLNDHAILTGWQSNKAVKKYLSESDLLCLTSVNEGLPMIGLEALASGLAIIGTDTAGIRDIIRDGENGFLVPLNDQGKYVARIEHLFRNKDILIRMKQNSLQMSQQFNWERIIRQYRDVFYQCIKNHA